jgi:O-antigen/teichoic acid export membrane protein
MIKIIISLLYLLLLELLLFIESLDLVIIPLVGYKKDVVVGISWITILRVATRAIAFLKTIFLARILAPSQFGAYGVALIVLGFLETMTETGVNVLLIQEEKTDKYINTAWVISIIRGFIIALFIIILTPYIVQFFRSPESAVLLYAISIVPFLRGFINPSVAKFQKELRFRAEFNYRLAIFFVDSITAIVVTLMTNHPIGIVIGLIAGVITEVILSYLIVRPLPIYEFNRDYINKLVHRGKWITASGVFNYLFHNADNFVVGRLLGTTSLGIYQVAYSLSIMPITEISDIFSRVTFPVFKKISGDRNRLRKAFSKTMLVIIILTIPFGLVFYFFSEQIVALVLGEKWSAVASLLPMLGIFGVIRGISGSTSSLFLAVGKQEYVTVVTFVSVLGLILPLVPLIMAYGMLGAAISALVGSIVALPFMAYYTWKVFR